MTAHGTIMLPSCNICVRGGVHWSDSGINLRGYGNTSLRFGTRETFSNPRCNGSCVFCLNKALIWLSVEGTNPPDFCRWTVLFFCPRESEMSKHGQQLFPPRYSPILRAVKGLAPRWTVRLGSSKLSWEDMFSLFCLPLPTYSEGILTESSRNPECSCCRPMTNSLSAPVSPTAWELFLVKSVISFEEVFQNSAELRYFRKPSLSESLFETLKKYENQLTSHMKKFLIWLIFLYIISWLCLEVNCLDYTLDGKECLLINLKHAIVMLICTIEW